MQKPRDTNVRTERMSTTENQIEQDLIAKLVDLKYTGYT